MLPYFLLIVIPILFSHICLTTENKQFNGIKIRKPVFFISIRNRRNNCNLALSVFFIVLFFVLALRDETIGRDLNNYKFIFETTRYKSFDNLFTYEPEMLYYLLNWIVARIYDDFQFFLAVVAAITIIPIAVTYCKDTAYPYLKIILFLNMSTFIVLFSGLRQSIAFSIGMIAYKYVKEKKFVKFLLFVLIAFGFHYSAFMLLFMYPLYHLKIQKIQALFTIPVIALIFILNKPIFSIFLSFITEYEDKYGQEIKTTGAYGMLLLFIIFAVFSFVITDEKKVSPELMGLRNFMLMAIVVQCFAPIHTVTMRLNYYYIIFIPMLLPKALQAASIKWRKVANIGLCIMCAFFTFYFLFNTYTSYKTGISTLDTVPYIPFWKG